MDKRSWLYLLLFFFLITLVRVIKALVLSIIVLWAQWHLLCCVHGENQIKEADVGKLAQLMTQS